MRFEKARRFLSFLREFVGGPEVALMNAMKEGNANAINDIDNDTCGSGGVLPSMVGSVLDSGNVIRLTEEMVMKEEKERPRLKLIVSNMLKDPSYYEIARAYSRGETTCEQLIEGMVREMERRGFEVTPKEGSRGENKNSRREALREELKEQIQKSPRNKD